MVLVCNNPEFAFLKTWKAAGTSIELLPEPPCTPPGPVPSECTTTIFSLATLIPALAAGWRRMHDTGRSGRYLHYPFIVMLGLFTFAGFAVGFGPLPQGNFAAILAGASALAVLLAGLVLFHSPLLVLWWLTRPSKPGTNKYGPNPHEVTP